MNLSDHELESMLHAVPQPRPPAELKQRLLAGINLADARNTRSHPATFRSSWWRRWWPSLATGTLTLVCLVVLGVQQNQLRNLQRSIDDLQQQIKQPKPLPKAAAGEPAASDASSMQIPNGRAELEQLRQEAGKLTGEVQALQNLQAENQRLRAQPALQPTLDDKEVQAMQAARDQANRIKCANNLKQLALAVRIWQTDHGDVLPPDVFSIEKEAVTPKLLVCPADASRKPAESWRTLSPANISYEYLAASSPANEMQQVMFRCPFHGNIAMVDGSVQSGVALTHPEWLVPRNGRLYYEPTGSSGAKAQSGVSGGAGGNQPANGMSEEMMRRYGLKSTPKSTSTTAPPQP